MLRRSLTSAASKRVLGVYFRPRVHAFVFSQGGAQGQEGGWGRVGGRVQRAAYSTGAKNWSWGSGGDMGPDAWANIISDWFTVSDDSVNFLWTFDKRDDDFHIPLHSVDQRDLRDEPKLAMPFTPEEIEELAEWIEKRVHYVYATANVQQGEQLKVFKVLAGALKELALAKRTKSHAPSKAYATVVLIMSDLTKRPILLFTEADMQMLIVLRNQLKRAINVGCITIVLNKLKEAGCTSSNISSIDPRALSSKIRDGKVCIHAAKWMVEWLRLAPKGWFSSDDEKLLLIMAGRLRQAGEKMRSLAGIVGIVGQSTQSNGEGAIVRAWDE